MRDTWAGPGMTRREALGVLPLIPAVTSALVTGAATARRASAASGGGKLVAGLPVDILNYDPYLGAAGSHQYLLARGIFETLTRYSQNLEPQPELATAWKLADNGLQVTLNLRKGVKFHSGREFTADDVLFSLKAVQDPKFAALARPLALPLSTEAKDKYTVTLSTEKPYAAIFDALDGLFIVDKDTAEPGFPQKAVGTGPFKQGQRVPGDFARFERFDDYWGGPAPLDGFELRPVPDLSALAISLESGTLDVAWRLSYQDFVRLRNTGKYQTLPGANAAIYYDLTLNTTVPAFKDKRVRQAVNWALDRKRFVDVVLRGVVEPTSIPYPRTSLAYDAELANKFQKNLAKAKDLIAAAGFAQGLEATILTSRRRNPGMLEMAEILQADLKTIGVNFKIEDVEPTVYDQKFESKAFDIAVHTFGRANKDPGTLYGAAIVWHTDPKRNPSSFQSDRYAQLVTAGATTQDRAKRKAIYRDITLLIQDECFCIPVAEQPRTWALQRRVQGFEYSPDNMPLWHKVSLAS
jgi:peptide/nickel transport system substrate-binding protein